MGKNVMILRFNTFFLSLASLREMQPKLVKNVLIPSLKTGTTRTHRKILFSGSNTPSSVFSSNLINKQLNFLESISSHTPPNRAQTEPRRRQTFSSSHSPLVCRVILTHLNFSSMKLTNKISFLASENQTQLPIRN